MLYLGTEKYSALPKVKHKTKPSYKHSYLQWYPAFNLGTLSPKRDASVKCSHQGTGNPAEGEEERTLSVIGDGGYSRKQGPPNEHD